MPEGAGNQGAAEANARSVRESAWPSEYSYRPFFARLKSAFIVPMLLLLLGAVFFSRNLSEFRPVIPFDLLSNYHPWRASAPAGAHPHENPELYDQAFQFYPWWTFIIGEIKAGRIPLWNPYSFCGSPLLANGQSGIFFPLNTLNFILNLNSASLVLAVGRLFVAAMFTYAFLRQLGMLRSSAVFGAVAFAFSRNMVVWLGFPAGSASILLPALFWACERLILSAGTINFIVAALLLCSQFFAGQPQTSLVTLFCLSTYVGIRLLTGHAPRSGKLRIFFLYGAAWGLALMLSAVQILPMMEYLKESAALPFRTQFNLKVYPWYEILSFVFPNFFGTPYEGNYWGFANLVGTACYVGVGPLLLALLSLRRAFRPGSVQSFWIIAAVNFAVVYNLPIVGRISSLPLFNGIDTNKYLVAIVFSLAVCSAYELDCILKRDSRNAFQRIAWLVASLLGFAILAGFIFRDFFAAMKLWPYELSNFCVFLFFAAACMGLILAYSLERLKPAMLAAGLIALAFADLFIFGHSFNASAPKERLPAPPESIQAMRRGLEQYRILGVQGVLPANASVLYGLADVRGYDAMTPARYYEFMSRVDRGYSDFTAPLNPDQGNSIDRSTLFKRELLHMLQVGGQPLRDLLKRVYYWNSDLDGLLGTSALDALAVKYILAPPGTRNLPANRFNLIQEGQVTVFENPHALPRCYLRDDFTVVNDAQALETIDSAGFDFTRDLLLSHVSETGILQTLPSGRNPESLSHSRAEIVSQSACSVVISVNAAEPAVLVLGDLYFPGWEADLDNQPVPIHAANYLFRAVVIPAAGMHTVQFRYWPRSFVLGAEISLLGVCACAALIAFAGIGGLRSKQNLHVQ
ncbi:MAG: YfhO family protein [Acidobacteriota bacterium]|jgi:hypothetical protein